MPNLRQTLFGAATALACVTGACSEEGLDRIPADGAVDGYVCHPTLDELAVGAKISGRGADGEPVTAVTDATGFFLLEGLAVGVQTLTVTGDGYTDALSITVVADQTTRLPQPGCLLLGTGAIQGRICASETGVGSGEGYWLAGASVWVDACAPDCIVTTAADGTFTIDEVPEGLHTLKVKKGSFSAEVPVTVVEDDTADVTQVCVAPTTRLTVVTGIFDSVQDVLDGIGFPVGACMPASLCSGTTTEGGNVTLVDGESSYFIDNLLLDPTALAEVDVLFFNCGLADAFLASAPPLAAQNLRDFVDGGGSIYASDWAYEVLRVAFPGLLDFAGDDASPAAARVGMESGALTADIVDATLAAVVGSATVSLDYNKSAWVPLAGQQDATMIAWVRGDVAFDVDQDLSAEGTIADAPLLVSIPYGQGKVVYTTFHTHAQVSTEMTAILRHIVFEL